MESEIHRIGLLMGLIHVVHPDLPPAEASLQDEAAYTKVWKSKGWVVIDAKQAVAHNQALADGQPSPVLADLKKGGK